MFFREIYCMLVISYVKINLYCYFSSWHLFHVAIVSVKHVICWFFVLKYVAYGFFIQKTWCFLIYVFEKLVISNFFAMKLVVCWFFSSISLYVDFCPCEIGLVLETCCVLIFCSWNLLHCVLLFTKLVFQSQNLLYFFFLYKTCYMFIFPPETL